MVKEDLETLTGTLIDDDITPVVISLLKGTKFRDDLLNYLSYSSDESLKKVLRRYSNNADNKEPYYDTGKECNRGLSLKEWFTN